MFQYFYWHYVIAPRFLLTFFWNVQIAVLQFFSVSLLVKTLFAHWHKDAVPYKGGTISDYVTAFAWNQISRVIGFIIRACTLSIWLVVQIIYLALAMSLFLLFILAPLLILLGLVAGLILTLS